MATSTKEIERQSIEDAEGIGKPGTILSTTIHDAIMAGGEPTRTIADILHGTWLGHPLHPILTDITIGAWTLGSAFDVVAAVTQSDAARDTADQLTAIGTASAIPTAITGSRRLFDVSGLVGEHRHVAWVAQHCEFRALCDVGARTPRAGTAVARLLTRR